MDPNSLSEVKIIATLLRAIVLPAVYVPSLQSYVSQQTKILYAEKTDFAITAMTIPTYISTVSAVSVSPSRFCL